MNEAEVTKQLNQMVQFIRQEAEEKANEIAITAEEEFNLEKLQLLNSEKTKIHQDYDKKGKQVETLKKVENSKHLNTSRLKILHAQNDLIRSIKVMAERKLISICENRQIYSILLNNLIVQSLFKLSEPIVQLRCREQDYELVESVLPHASEEYAHKAKVDVPEVFIDDERFLPGPPGKGKPGPFCSGGVVLASRDGRIVCENTLDARLDISFKHNLPQLRKCVFDNDSAKFDVDVNISK